MKLKTFLALALLVFALYWPTKALVDAVTKPKPAQAQASSDTQTGAATQPGSAELGTSSPERINNLEPNDYTPENYVPPKFDPFNNIYKPESDYEEPYPPFKQPNTKPEADFSMQPRRSGFAEKNMATVGTEFRFSAGASSDAETSGTRLSVRWDFEGDGVVDTYFSRNKNASHYYKTPGIYNVKLEVLDANGGVSSTTKKIKIVENTAPFAYQVAKVKSATLNTVFDFDTSNSSDSQYLKQFLEYRFDWEGDGVFDTVYKNKTLWKHKFETAGNYHVVMEVKDPEGLTATYYQNVEVLKNMPPFAIFTVEQKVTERFGKRVENFNFDASGSSDEETAHGKLLYRWDFNYTGEDDIIFDTNFTTLPKYTGHYDVPGHKIIRLQVKDADGAISEAFAEFDAG